MSAFLSTFYPTDLFHHDASEPVDAVMASINGDQCPRSQDSQTNNMEDIGAFQQAFPK